MLDCYGEAEFKKDCRELDFVTIDGGVELEVGRRETYVNDCHYDEEAKMLNN